MAARMRYAFSRGLFRGRINGGLGQLCQSLVGFGFLGERFFQKLHGVSFRPSCRAQVRNVP